MKKQETDVTAFHKAQQYITPEEWSAIEADIATSLQKSDKKRTKTRLKIDKRYIKWENKISAAVPDEDRRKKAIASVARLRTIHLRNYEILQAELLNKNSTIYQYDATDEVLNAFQDKFVNRLKEIYQANTATHFELVELLTPEEWKKIN